MWKILSEFKKFALRGNVVDLAVGFTVGVAFTTVVKSAVDDLVMPMVGLMVGRVEFSDLFFLLKPGPEISPPYTTLAEAQAAGAVTVNYGLFINNLMTFSIIALVMFGLIRLINHLEDQIEEELGLGGKQETEPDHKKCPYCLSTIPHKATRCPECTSHLESVRQIAS
jgi:large conductance mechanosensitive channel